MITHIKHTLISVDDPNRAIEFYVHKLGLTKLVDATFDQVRWIELGTPEGNTCLVLYCDRTEEKVKAAQTNLYNFMGTQCSNIVFTCADVHKTTQDLKDQGVTLIDGPIDADWGTYANFEDTEGNRFCLSST